MRLQSDPIIPLITIPTIQQIGILKFNYLFNGVSSACGEIISYFLSFCFIVLFCFFSVNPKILLHVTNGPAYRDIMRLCLSYKSSNDFTKQKHQFVVCLDPIVSVRGLVIISQYEYVHQGKKTGGGLTCELNSSYNICCSVRRYYVRKYFSKRFLVVTTFSTNLNVKNSIVSEHTSNGYLFVYSSV